VPRKNKVPNSTRAVAAEKPEASTKGWRNKSHRPNAPAKMGQASKKIDNFEREAAKPPARNRHSGETNLEQRRAELQAKIEADSPGALADIEQKAEERLERLRRLDEDNTFFLATQAQKSRLVELWKNYRVEFDAFFDRFTYLEHALGGLGDKLVAGTSNVVAREILANYVRYVDRFRVELNPCSHSKRDSPDFDLFASLKSYSHAPRGWRFEARITKGRIEPLETIPEPVFEEMFRCLAEGPLTEAEYLAKKTGAKVIVLQDDESASLLTQIERVAYDPDTLTFVVHRNRGQSYLLCMIGEGSPTDKRWRDAAPVVTAFRKYLYDRNLAGRRVDREHMQHVAATGSLSHGELQHVVKLPRDEARHGGRGFYSAEQYESRARKKLRQAAKLLRPANP
jgi:hypothetical protein